MRTPIPDYAGPQVLPRFKVALLGLLIGIGVTPGALFLAYLSTGAGHGSYALTRAFFPLPMLATRFTQDISTPLIIVGILQFPLYGLIIGYEASCGRKIGIIAIGAIHLSAAVACFIPYILPGF